MDQNPTALLSWAHTASDWDATRAAEWENEVVGFVRELRRLGIDVDLDLHHESEPGIDWTRFGPRAVFDKDWVIVALSEAWRERWEARNDPTTGAGVAAEADALLSIFNSDQAEFRRKVVLVVLPSMMGKDVIPGGLHGLQRFSLTEISLSGLEPLIRLITGQPRRPAEPLGTLPVLPPAVAPSGPHVPVSPPSTTTPRAPSGTARLVAALDDPDADVQYEALSALRERLSPDLLPVVERFLDHADPYLRRMAIDYYAQLSDRSGTARLVAALDDPDADVQYEALSALRERLSPDLLPVVERFLDHADPYLRRMAIDYYAQLSDRSGTARLVAALDDPDADVQYEALSALRERLSPDLLPVVERFLDHADPYLRRMAIDYYAQLSDRHAEAQAGKPLDGGSDARTVSIPIELDKGFLRRECPHCEREFKWLDSSAVRSEPDVTLGGGYHCPYCNRQADGDQWLTKAQVEYLGATALEQVTGPILDELRSSVEGVNRTGGGMVGARFEPVSTEPPVRRSEPHDMRRVDFECHPREPVKVLETWSQPVHCLMCGAVTGWPT